MKAMVLRKLAPLHENDTPLELMELPVPVPKDGELLIEVAACGVCHTELDEIEGRTPPATLPLVPGHQVVGRVEKVGGQGTRHSPGDRVGVAWIYTACGQCRFCKAGLENLCHRFRATGRDADGGYAEYMVVPEQSAYPIPECFGDTQAAPLLCAGAIGYRSLQLTHAANGMRLGLTGFGASGHLVLKLARHRYPDAEVYVFARNPREQDFARELGAVWAGDTADASPRKLDAIIDTTPAWRPMVAALQNLAPGGRLVINAIRKEEVDKQQLLQLDYPLHLWMEKEIKSVANICRRDVTEFLDLAADMHMQPEVEEYPLAEANRALAELKAGQIRGAKVLVV
jgi:propanol-preferring alcohol dehydrogenase